MRGTVSWILVASLVSLGTGRAFAQVDPLPSWNDGPAKQAIVSFVRATTDKASAQFVPPAERIATFDQDGTLWVEQPMYTPPEQVVGSAGATQFGCDKAGRPTLTKVPKLLLNDDKAGKPEGIHLVIGRRPVAAFGNSVGDKEMLEYTGAGGGARLMMLVHHDDAVREFAYGPASKRFSRSSTRVGMSERRRPASSRTPAV